MSDEPIEIDVARMGYTVTDHTPIGCQLVKTDFGPVHFCEANGVNVVGIEANGPGNGTTSVGLLIYIDGAEGENGRGQIMQLDPQAARDVAAALLAKAGEMDGERAN